MTTPEHLDPETTAPDLPDGYDLDGGWEPTEWLEQFMVDNDELLRRLADGPGGLDALRPADFDDQETRP